LCARRSRSSSRGSSAEAETRMSLPYAHGNERSSRNAPHRL
jgi:hypothetical protein